MLIKLETKLYPIPKSASITLNGAEFVGMNEKALIKLQKSAKELFEQNKVKVNFAEKVTEILSSPIPKRDANGEPLIDQNGMAQPKGISIVDQTKIFRIVDEVDKKFSTAVEFIEIELSTDDAKYLCQRIQEHCKYTTVPARFMVDLYNYFVEIEAMVDIETKKAK